MHWARVPLLKQVGGLPCGLRFRHTVGGKGPSGPATRGWGRHCVREARPPPCSNCGRGPRADTPRDPHPAEAPAPTAAGANAAEALLTHLGPFATLYPTTHRDLHHRRPRSVRTPATRPPSPGVLGQRGRPAPGTWHLSASPLRRGSGGARRETGQDLPPESGAAGPPTHGRSVPQAQTPRPSRGFVPSQRTSRSGDGGTTSHLGDERFAS